MAEFCSARSNTISPPQWTTFAPPFTIPIGGQIAAFDIPFTLGIAVLSLAVIFFFKNIGRVTGGFFLLAYISYIAWLYLNGAMA